MAPLPPGRSCARVVKPRKRTSNADRPIIAVDIATEDCVDENGETYNVPALIQRLPGLPPHIFVCNGNAEFVARCHEKYSHDPLWQFKATPTMREHWRPHKKGKTRRFSNLTVIDFFGWQSPNSRKQAGCFHFTLDPLVFSDRPRDKYPVGLTGLLQWAQELRQFCLDEIVNLRPTQGSLARQFLRDPRFYPEPRRKVPIATNEKIRPHIGTNHFENRVIADKQYQGRYLDQHSAHHFHAQNTNLPASDFLYGYGRFRGIDKPWKVLPERIAEFLAAFHGVVLAHINWTPKAHSWFPDNLNGWKPGKPVWIYTNELDLYTSIGVTITSLIGAWGAFTKDTGLAAYARHAEALLADSPPDWLKPLLLSVYGCLATTPKKHTVGFAKAKRGEPTELLAGRLKLPALLVTTDKAREPGTNNVVQRGMIEAATRAETLMYANYLQHEGVRVLGVYVDAVIIDDEPVSLILDPWKDKQPLTGLRFLASNAFVSLQMTKVPGTAPRDVLLRTSPGSREGASARIGDADKRMKRRVDAWDRHAWAEARK